MPINFPNSVDTDAVLGVAVNGCATTLDGALLADTNGNNGSATEITVVSTTNFPSAGIFCIADEAIRYTGKSATKFTGITRGVDGTTIAAHANGSAVELKIVAEHHNYLKDALVVAESYLLGGWLTSSDTLAFDSSTNDPEFTAKIVNSDKRSKYFQGTKLKCTQDESATLKLFLKLNEVTGTNADDASAYNHDGTASRSNIFSSGSGAGKFGASCGVFASASSDKITIVDHADLKPTTFYTVSAWFKTSTTGAFQFIFQTASQNSNVAGIKLFITNTNVMRLYSGNNTGTTPDVNLAQVTGVTNVCDNAWHHVVATWNGKLCRLYIDGKIEAERYWPNAPAYAATNYVRVGCENSSGSDGAFMNGSIDNVVLLNGIALSEKEILAEYNGTETTPADNLAAYEKYFIVTDSVLSGADTVLYLHGGQDYKLANATISGLSFALPKTSPYGFPMDGSIWADKYFNYVLSTQATPTAATFYNIGTHSLQVKRGIWKVGYFMQISVNENTAQTVTMACALSKANNAVTDPYLLSSIEMGIRSAETTTAWMNRNKILKVFTATIYYLIVKISQSGIDNIYTRGEEAPVGIYAENELL